MIIAIALIIGWAIGRKVNRRQRADKIRAFKESGGSAESRVLSQADQDHLAASIRESKPKEQMKRKLPPSRRTVGH